MHALIVDDDSQHAAALVNLLAELEFKCVTIADLESADSALSGQAFQLVFLSLVCAGEAMLPLLSDDRVRSADEIILMNDVDDPPLVQQGIRQGATYFFCKPFDPNFIRTIASDLARELTEDSTPRPADPCPLDQFGLLRGSSPPMRRMYRIMRKVAQSSTSVLLIGESGTGKELVASTLHQLSQRGDNAFVAMNCAAVPKELFESELFGHEKGAFSGATARHQGFFERAHGGTLFLDEITEMPLELQVKLLRVLELGRYRRVGGEHDQTSDVRIIAATNRDPESAISDSLLREDLYYRVARFPLQLPPLRERGEDIEGLAHYFLNRLNEENGRHTRFTDEALAVLRSHSWPGNVRELMSVVEKATILAEDRIDPAHLAVSAEASPTADDDSLHIPIGASIDEVERELILATLEAHDGDKKAAASTLGISLKTLYNRLNDYRTGNEEQR